MKVTTVLKAIIDVVQMPFHPIVLSCVALPLKSIFFSKNLNSWLYDSITYLCYKDLCSPLHLLHRENTVTRCANSATCIMTLQFQVPRGTTDIDITPESSIMSGGKWKDQISVPQLDSRLQLSQIQFNKLTVELSQ